MISKSHTVRLPANLYEVIQLRAQLAGYRDVSAYLRGLARYDALVQGTHDVTLPMSHLPNSEQDKIDAQLLEATQKGVGVRGQMLRHLLEEIQRQGKGISAEAVVKALAEKAVS